jgi:hypothetical protein
MLVPIVFRPPAVFVLIPPAVLLAPATFSRRVQFTTFVIGLPAVASMALDGLVEIMLGMSHPALAAVDVFRVKAGSGSKEKGCCQQRS